MVNEHDSTTPESAIKGLKPVYGKKLVADFEASKLSRHFVIKLTDDRLVEGDPARLIYATETYLSPRYTVSGSGLAEAVYGLGQPYHHDEFQTLVTETNTILSDYDQSVLSRVSQNAKRPFADRVRYFRAQLVKPKIPGPLREEHLSGIRALCTDPSISKDDLVAMLGPKPNGDPYLPSRALGSYVSGVMQLYSRVTETKFRAATASDEEVELWNLLRETFSQTDMAKLDNYQFGGALRSRFWQLYRREISSFIPEDRINSLSEVVKIPSEQQEKEKRDQMEKQFQEHFRKMKWLTELQYQVLRGVYFAPGMRVSTTDLLEAVYGGRYDRGSDTVRNEEGRIIIECPKENIRSIIRGLNKTHLPRINTQIKNVPLTKSERPSSEWSFNEGRYTFLPSLDQINSRIEDQKA